MNSFEELKKLLEQGVSLGLNLKDQIKKVEHVINSLNSDTIRIVLLGSFSDGKTSVVAGMLGKVLDNMKIDIDESSDELTFYNPGHRLVHRHGAGHPGSDPGLERHA